MSNLLYISCHSVLEYLEVSMFTRLGWDVFSNGAYIDPKGHYLLPRPGIEGAKYFEHLAGLARENPKTALPKEMIEWADVIVFMAGITDNALISNWPHIRHKKVVWRTIGQSTPSTEQMIAPLRSQGLKIVRYSPKESLINNFIGQDAIIRFPADEDELGNWNGNDPSVVNFTQSLKGRRNFCHYDTIVETMSGFPSRIYGTGNDDLGTLNGGELPWELMKGRLRDARCYLYAGTWPAPYTLSFIEALTTGIPIVSIGKNLAENIQGIAPNDKMSFFEIPEFGENGEHFFMADDTTTLRSYVYQLLNDHDLAKRVSEKARKRAIELFSRKKIEREWRDFLGKL